MMKSKNIALFLALIVFLLACSDADKQQTSPMQNNAAITDSLDKFISYSGKAVTGGTVYIPVYSHIYQQNRSRTFNLTATLSIRNTDLNAPIRVKKVYYYDSDGNLVHKYLDSTQVIAPLSSTSFVVEEEDLRGGVGANYLVLWEAGQTVNQPVFEAVMISTAQNQGVSFVSEGRVINNLNNPQE